MRRYSLSWVIVMLVLMLAIIFFVARPTITGYAVNESGRDLPVYLTTFLILIILLIFLILMTVGISAHTKKSRIKEEESIRELLKNIK